MKNKNYAFGGAILLLIIVGCNQKIVYEKEVDYIGHLLFPHEISFKSNYSPNLKEISYDEGKIVFLIVVDSLGQFESCKMKFCELTLKNKIVFQTDTDEEIIKGNESALFTKIKEDFLAFFKENIVYTRNENPLSYMGAFRNFLLQFDIKGNMKITTIR